MKEREFIQILQERAQEQRTAMKAVPFPSVFAFIIEWLSDHPWRFLIPLALLISIILRAVWGTNFTDAVLTLFRSI